MMSIEELRTKRHPRVTRETVVAWIYQRVLGSVVPLKEVWPPARSTTSMREAEYISSNEHHRKNIRTNNGMSQAR